MRSALFILFAILSAGPVQGAARSDDDLDVGDVVKMRISDVQPAQALVGRKEVDMDKEKFGKYFKKKKKIEKKLADDALDAGDRDRLERKLAKAKTKLKQQLKHRPGKIALGPRNRNDKPIRALFDGNHETDAQDELGIRKSYFSVEKDWSGLSEKRFWKKMRKRKLAYLLDAKGNPISYEDLPETVSGLQDYPLRSLAGFVRDAAGFDKEETPFQEFYWADFFRDEGIKLSSKTDTGYANAFAKAMNLAGSKDAKNLPGWKGEKKPKPKCHWIQLYRELFADR